MTGTSARCSVIGDPSPCPRLSLGSSPRSGSGLSVTCRGLPEETALPAFTPWVGSGRTWRGVPDRTVFHGVQMALSGGLLRHHSVRSGLGSLDRSACDW